MKTQRLSVALLVAFAAVSTSHTKSAQALTYEEVSCMAQALADAQNPMQCVAWGIGGGGSGAGSGGSGSGGADGSGSADGGGPIFFPPQPFKCSVPAFFFTGPPDPATASFSVGFPGHIYAGGVDITQSTLTFVQSVGGKSYQFQRQITEKTGLGSGGGPVDLGTTFQWTVTQLGSSGPIGTPQTQSCME